MDNSYDEEQDYEYHDLYYNDEYDYVSEEVMFENGYVGDYYEDEDDFIDDELPVACVKVKSPMMKYPMAVKISMYEAEFLAMERYLFVSDGCCVLNREAWPLITVKNVTVSTMRINAQDSLYYFPDFADQQSYLNEHHIVIKKEDMLEVANVSEAIMNHNTFQHEATPPSSRQQNTNDYDDIPF